MSNVVVGLRTRNCCCDRNAVVIVGASQRAMLLNNLIAILQCCKF